jgi:hypothetical protein
MIRSPTTASPTHGVMVRAATPPRTSTSRICSVAYATLESGSEQKTGSANHLGSSEWAARSLLRGLPTMTRLRTEVTTLAT